MLQYYLLVMIFYVSRFAITMFVFCVTTFLQGALLFVRLFYAFKHEKSDWGNRFGTPISLLVKRFSAARVLPLMMVGFVRHQITLRRFGLIQTYRALCKNLTCRSILKTYLP